MSDANQRSNWFASGLATCMQNVEDAALLHWGLIPAALIT
jgi:hypothetical protein